MDRETMQSFERSLLLLEKQIIALGKAVAQLKDEQKPEVFEDEYA